MKPTEILKEEHRVIEKVLGGIEAEVARLNEGGEFNPEFFEKAADFIRNFADGAHHRKEEDQLFPVLEERGVPREGGPVGCMLEEHEQGRGFVRAMREAIEQSDADAAAQNAAGYAALLRNHIYKEDNILYPASDSMMTEQDQAKLTAIFDKIEADFAATGDAEKYRRIAEELSNAPGQGA